MIPPPLQVFGHQSLIRSFKLLLIIIISCLGTFINLIQDIYPYFVNGCMLLQLILYSQQKNWSFLMEKPALFDLLTGSV